MRDDGRVDGAEEAAWVTYQPLPGDHCSFLTGFLTTVLGPFNPFSPLHLRRGF